MVYPSLFDTLVLRGVCSLPGVCRGGKRAKALLIMGYEAWFVTPRTEPALSQRTLLVTPANQSWQWGAEQNLQLMQLIWGC